MKQTHKLKALGNVAAVIADSKTDTEAAARLGVDRSTIYRWRMANKIRVGGNRHSQPAGSTTQAEAANVAIPLDHVINGPRPGPSDPARDALWRELRRRVSRAEYMHPRFDPRRMPQDPAQLALWRATRRAWLKELFRG